MTDARAIRTAAPSTACPSWCTAIDHLNDDGHQGAPIVLSVPGDETGYYDDGEPYEVLWAAIVRESGAPTRIYLDALGDASGGGTNLDLAAADAVLADLKLYVARFEQLRDHLAAITANTTANTANSTSEHGEHTGHQGEQA
ncbi:hypothetical protein ABTX35_39085 [Streptomyces sp. NPDC096080]|uniref:DUF6907 domain-containing protein n=1 Tax=Streptomyces sp. NPDC096080 TaxID=3156693 RepID=UPI0033310F63